MTASAIDIADELRAAAQDGGKMQETLAGLFAETVVLRHEPPSPSDGAISGSLISAISRKEVAAAGRALPDAVQGDVNVSIEGDGIRVQTRTSGVLADGTTIDVKSNTLFTVADGAIVGLQSDMDAASVEAWRKVLSAGGFEIPTGLVPDA
jgi:hypothetical protein